MASTKASEKSSASEKPYQSGEEADSETEEEIRSAYVPDEPREGDTILCLDGGDIRGLNEIEFLMKLEELTNAKIRDLFDWIGGTSIGGILALGIAVGKELSEIKHLYWRLKDQVCAGEKPSDWDKLDELLKDDKIFGKTMKMTDIKGPKVIVTGTEANVFPPRLHLFRSYKRAPHQQLETKRKAISYWIETKTGDRRFAGTDAHIDITIYGEFGDTGKLNLRNSMTHPRNKFERGQTDTFSIIAPDVGEVEKIKIEHDNANPGASWFLEEVQIKSPTRSQHLIFEHHKWIPNEDEDGKLEVELKVPTKQGELVWEAARCTLAVPTYLTHFGPYRDGGLVSNNPTLDVLSEIQRHFEGKSTICCLVSLGCGRLPSSENAQGNWKDISGIAHMMSTVNLKSLLNLAYVFLHETTCVDQSQFYRAMSWCKMVGICFFGYNPKLKEEISLDCKDEKLLKMVKRTQTSIARHSKIITRLANMLSKNLKMKQKRDNKDNEP